MRCENKDFEKEIGRTEEKLFGDVDMYQVKACPQIQDKTRRKKWLKNVLMQDLTPFFGPHS
ncbi:hypothetical protein ES707_06981 [subsurface metagenome]